MPTQRQIATADSACLEKLQATLAAYGDGELVRRRLAADMQQVIEEALAEDLNLNAGASASRLCDADITTAAIVPSGRRARATMFVKSPGTVAGLPAACLAFQLADPNLKTTHLVEEGAVIEVVPSAIAHFEGSARAILIAERTALNVIQRLSGIATCAGRFAKKAAALGIAILDTRKTTPGLRTLEKYAVSVGGAGNHRFGLFDAILIKDNHIRLAGGVAQALRLVRESEPGKPVEVEVTNLPELEEALAQGAQKILLDNMSPDQVKEAVKVAGGRALIEVSGGVNPDNLDSYLIAGVDAISVGALTHSVVSLDISLEIEV